MANDNTWDPFGHGSTGEPPSDWDPAPKWDDWNVPPSIPDLPWDEVYDQNTYKVTTSGWLNVNTGESSFIMDLVDKIMNQFDEAEVDLSGDEFTTFISLLAQVRHDPEGLPPDAFEVYEAYERGLFGINIRN